MKILHTADIHLRAYGDERWKALQKLMEIGKIEKIEFLVICGDLFDANNDAENLRPNIREIFSNNGFKIIIIPGNHDHKSYQDMYFGEDAVILTEANNPYEHKDLRIWGLPFELLDSENILIKLHSLRNKMSNDTKNIILYHGELLDAFFSRKDLGEEGEERYMPVRLSYFDDQNINYVLAGHFHSNFDIRMLEGGGYFVYPGSPISITKREIGQRKVNIFEVGGTPKEYPLDTPHFEEVNIELDPLRDNDPLYVVKAQIDKVHPEARIILNVGGYINSEKIKMKEPELVEKIRQITNGRSEEEHFEFKDIHTLLEDDLFKSFMKKLEQTDLNDERKRQLHDIAIKAMMGIGS